MVRERVTETHFSGLIGGTLYTEITGLSRRDSISRENGISTRLGTVMLCIR